MKISQIACDVCGVDATNVVVDELNIRRKAKIGGNKICLDLDAV